MTFYAYRAVSDEAYAPINVNLANLPGVLWYLHHEVVITSPRKFNIKKILRYKVQVRATEPLKKIGMNFGVRLAFDKGMATGPFVCGRREKEGADKDTHYSPEFCGDANGEKGLQPPWMEKYHGAFEWSEYGFNVGCNKLGQYPYPRDKVYYPNAVWYSFPGLCPDKPYYDKGTSCSYTAPGGYCPGVTPNGNGTCTWNYEPAGQIDIDELVGYPSGKKEYDPETDRGTGCCWWDGLNMTAKNEERIRQAEELFAMKYPGTPSLSEPSCDFNFRRFYNMWYHKDGEEAPCGEPSAECLESIEWIRSEGLKKHPSWYGGLSADSSTFEIQYFQYTTGKGGCVEPCA